jgi:hypothetical protein
MNKGQNLASGRERSTPILQIAGCTSTFCRESVAKVAAGQATLVLWDDIKDARPLN